jgi:hypothetical protein
MMIAPARRSRRTTGASCRATSPLPKIFDPAVVGASVVRTMSFTEMGTPNSGGSVRFRCITTRSAFRAVAIAWSPNTAMNALSDRFSFSMRASASATTSTGEIRRFRICSAISSASGKSGLTTVGW